MSLSTLHLRSRAQLRGLVSVALMVALYGPAYAQQDLDRPVNIVPVVEPSSPVTTGSIASAERAWRPSGGGDVDTSAVARAIGFAKAGRVQAATEARASLGDPVARALVEWVLLRSVDGAGFPRLSAFLREYPGFPASQRIRQRAEAALLDDGIDGATVRAFLADQHPVSAKGKVALALALKQVGQNDRAMRLIREAWRKDDLSSETERSVISAFGNQLTATDHRARLAKQIFEENTETAMRAAQRLGPAYVALARAAFAVANRQSNGSALTAAIPASVHHEPMYQFVKAQSLRRADKTQEAAAIMAAASRDPVLLGSPEEWWTERRVLVRKLLDEGDARGAYRMAAGHAVTEGSARVEAEFHAGWVALRALREPQSAVRHFEAARAAAHTPMSMSRANYWLGRAHEANGHSAEARRSYEQAARHTSHYYGQLARAKLGMTDLPVRRPAETAEPQSVAARALKMLYAAGERDLALAMLAELGARGNDQGQLHAAGEVAARNNDARGALTLGKGAVNRGLPFDLHAFPTFGIPPYRHVGPEVDRAVVYAIARQESTFNAKAVSHAGARGLLQLMPGTARATARTYGLSFDNGRLISDPAYNAQLGAAHLGELIAEYNGSYILTFAAYNAGRGRVREWIEAYGDPRNPSVDPIDWVERIPFSETRNYVQRILENVQVYRARIAGSSGLRIEADLRRGRTN